jgi:hypothetical protein
MGNNGLCRISRWAAEHCPLNVLGYPPKSSWRATRFAAPNLKQKVQLTAHTYSYADLTFFALVAGKLCVLAANHTHQRAFAGFATAQATWCVAAEQI